MVSAPAKYRLLYGAFAVIVVVVLAAVVFAVVRSRNTEDALPPPPSIGPASAAPTPTLALPAEVLTTYNGYMEAYIAATHDPNATNDLRKFIGDPLLADIALTLKTLRDNGIVYKGRPQWTPRATMVNTTTAPFSVVIEDCLDSTGWDAVYAATGQSAAAPGQLTRYPTTSTAKFYDGIGWLLVESRADRTRTC